MTVRLSIQLVLAQAVKGGRCSEDARGHVHRLLKEAAIVRCKCCPLGAVTYQVPINDLRSHDYDEIESDKWTVYYDHNATPTAEEADSLDVNEAHVSLRGVKLVSPLFDLSAENSSEILPNRAHDIDMNTEIGAVLQLLQDSQKTISDGSDGKAPSSFLYASPNCRMTVSIDSTDSFAAHTYDRVELFMNCCERQYDVLTACPSLTNVMDIFSVEALSSDGEESVEDGDDTEEEFGRHPFDSAIDFAQLPSTLDSAQVTAWIDVVVNTVGRCEEAVASYFDWQLSPDGDFSAPEFSSMLMLRHLGCKETTVDHFQSRLAARPIELDEAVASAMNAIFNDNPLGTLALHVVKTTAADTDPDTVRYRIKMKLLSGGYGMHPREYTRKALVAVGAEGVQDHEEFA
ncbi:hypothetical protein CB0940_12102 [Cercospora beticola]|uniref:Uncharacterized protein n=1 Tax=Cercospora beticola TaxID=122368 RepID=A0A2G5GIV9_CERBT|nr:hypothetical protein CB0940_12102 [Cercospora beticola]PIA80002.1 hypothetical protein CB0940_12102 [Cercospora beticola]WPB07663.1 hypothetical protein RHO25_012324 [Cercospora beticola]CAK1356534.1 unnamed protein product [Cercospora beticola]